MWDEPEHVADDHNHDTTGGNDINTDYGPDDGPGLYDDGRFLDVDHHAAWQHDLDRARNEFLDALAEFYLQSGHIDAHSVHVHDRLAATATALGAVRAAEPGSAD